MKAWLRGFWDAARLRTEVFAGLAARSDAFLQGCLVILVVALIAGLPALVLDLAGGMQPREPADLTAARGNLLRALEDAGPVLERLGLGSDVREQLARGLDIGLTIGTEVDALPTALPRPIGVLFQSVGGWLSRPFAGGGFPLAAAALGTWLGYGIWVMLFARLLGGRGALHSFFGATALYAVPHLLGVLDRVPVVGAAAGIIAILWGILIYVKATAVSQKLSFERALLAVVLPLLILVVLAVLLLPVIGGGMAIFFTWLGGVVN